MDSVLQNLLPVSDSVSVPIFPNKCFERLALEDLVSFLVTIPRLLLSTSELSDVFDFVWFLEFSDSVFSESCLFVVAFGFGLLFADEELSELSESELLSAIEKKIHINTQMWYVLNGIFWSKVIPEDSELELLTELLVGLLVSFLTSFSLFLSLLAFFNNFESFSPSLSLEFSGLNILLGCKENKITLLLMLIQISVICF